MQTLRVDKGRSRRTVALTTSEGRNTERVRLNVPRAGHARYEQIR
jgi:hypothetical protein